MAFGWAFAFMSIDIQSGTLLHSVYMLFRAYVCMYDSAFRSLSFISFFFLGGGRQVFWFRATHAAWFVVNIYVYMWWIFIIKCSWHTYSSHLVFWWMSFTLKYCQVHRLPKKYLSRIRFVIVLFLDASSAWCCNNSFALPITMR